MNLTRRIPVREERESGWRTRVVDHGTESMINEATRPCDKVQHDDIGLLAFIVAFMLERSVMAKLWKRDISSASDAFRFVLVTRSLPGLLGFQVGVFGWHSIWECLLGQ